MELRVKNRLSVEEYLDLERQAETRSEFLDGEMFAMSGASLRHNALTMNLGLALQPRLRRQGCRAFSSDMRVRISATDLFAYPDVVVVCGAPELGDAAMDTLLNPKVIFEVLSPTTEGYDRGLKFEHYRLIPSLTDYVLVAQDRVHVDHFLRQADGRWLLEAADTQGASLDLSSLGLSLSLAEIYQDVFELPA